MERTLVLIKPDGVEKKLIGEVIRRYEQKGMKVAKIQSLYATREMVEEHYKEHQGKTFYDELINYVTSGMIIAMIIEGPNSIKCIRNINGATRYQEAVPGSIRGDYANQETKNIVHASDSVESAEREIAIWFKE
jgi:nucleoside-diphosphate kinase